jgi:hypothetical protein
MPVRLLPALVRALLLALALGASNAWAAGPGSGTTPGSLAAAGTLSGGGPAASERLAQAATSAPAASPLPTLPLPPEVRALSSLVGLGRQRLALVMSQPRAAGLDLPATTRDAQAVAAALQAGGFVVMRRDDVGAAELRRAVKEFRDRLTPSGIGFVYFAGAGAQADGRSLLLTRDLARADGADAQALRDAALPLATLVEALQVTPSRLRLLVVDAAPPLPALAPALRGLAEPALPDGVMALLSAPPGADLVPLRPPPVAGAPSTDPRALAASPFGTALVHALTMAGSTGPDVLRQARRLAMDGTGGRLQPWLGGRTDEDDALGEPGLMGALPGVQQNLALAAVRRAAGLDAGQLLDRPADTAEIRPPAPESGSDLPSLPPGTLPAVAAGVGAAVAVGQAGSALPGVVVEPAAQAVVEAVVDTARQAVGAALPPAQPRDGRLPDQREAIDLAPMAPAVPASAAEPAPGPVAPPTPAPAQPVPAPSPPPAPTGGVLPPMNPNGYAVGDSFTYRHTDERTGKALGVLTQVILQLTSDDEMQARENDGVQVLDGQGRTRRRHGPAGQSAFVPVEQFWWANPKPGESRDVDFTETYEQAGAQGQRHWTGEVEVGDPEQLDTPAGRFRVLPMEGSGWFVQADAGGRPLGAVKWERTVWYAPDLGHPVAIDIVERDGYRQWLRRERIELTQARTSRTVPR